MAVFFASFVPLTLKEKGSVTMRLYSKTLFALSVFATSTFGLAAVGQSNERSVELDHLKRQNVEERLEPLGLDLLGDRIDLNTGDVSFSATDVSLPGNSSLPVEFVRSRAQGWRHPHIGDDHTSFDTTHALGDWSVDVPQISVVRAFGRESDGDVNSSINDVLNYQGPKCATEVIEPTIVFMTSANPNPGNPDITLDGTNQQIFEGDDVSNGVELSVPGRVSEKLIPVTATGLYPSGTEYVTKSHWISKCVNGVQEVTAPNGDIYTFDQVHIRPFEGLKAHGVLIEAYTNPEVWSTTAPRLEFVLRATEVTDVHGNWVKYEYSPSGFLNRIYSDDGREISVTRDPATGLISSVTANKDPSGSVPPSESVERTWTYDYETIDERTHLTEVTLPDARKWQIDFGNFPIDVNDGINCRAQNKFVSITHPSGVTGNFVFKEISRPLGDRDVGGTPKRRACGSGTPYYQSSTFDTFAVTSKSLTGASIPAGSEWTYSYSAHPYGQPNLGLWGEVEHPNGVRERTHFHHDGVFEGLRISKETFDENDILVREETYAHQAEQPLGTTFLTNTNTAKFTRPRYDGQIVVSQLGDSYTTAYQYNSDQNAANYSYGSPVRMDESSSTHARVRTEVVTYEHLSNIWKLSLPKTITRNDKLFDEFFRNSEGRIETHNKFGIAIGAYTYNTDGTLATAADALGNTYAFSQYKRGIPQLVTQPDLTTISRVVDDNGWVEAITNARGHETSYLYNDVGWLTDITRPGTFAPTSITYNQLGSGLTQILVRDDLRTTITYDGLHRPILIKEEDTSGDAADIYTKTTYDALNRLTFESLPSASVNPTEGMETLFDALGRIEERRQTMAPFASTKYEYLTGNEVRVTDPRGYQTTTTYETFGVPQNDPLDRGAPFVYVDHPIGADIEQQYDIFGNLTHKRSVKGGSTLAETVTEYDDRLRSIAEIDAAGDVTRTFYDDNNQPIIVKDGENRATRFVYDEMRRLDKTIKAWGGGDDGFGQLSCAEMRNAYDPASGYLQQCYQDNEYDANGNLNQVIDARGNITSYTYNELDLPLKTTFPDGTFTEVLSYDDLENPISILMRDGSSVHTAKYDAQKRMIAMRTPTRETTYAYDSVGRRTCASVFAPNTIDLDSQIVCEGVNGGRLNQALYTYDAAGRLLNEQVSKSGASSLSVGYGYDDVDNRTLITWPDGFSVQYEYDALGRMSNVKNANQSVIAHYDYDDRSRLQSITYGGLSFGGCTKRLTNPI